MNSIDLLKQTAVQATNALLVAHGQQPIVIQEYPVKSALDAYRINQSANAWDELEKLCAKAAMFEEMVAVLKNTMRWYDQLHKEDIKRIETVIARAEALL